MKSRWQQWLGLAALAALGGGPVSAHHSFAMYDNDKVVAVEGTVKEFLWANPHVVLRVQGTSAADSAEQLWTLELTAPGQLSRNGWTHSTLKAGDKVKVELHPFRNGRAGGAFMNVTLADGRKIDR